MKQKVIKCLVVDDEPIACEIIESYLQKIPHINLIATCHDALSAMEYINNENVDLIFLDIHMPELSGLALAKLIKNKTSVIFTTAYREYAVDGFDLKAVDYLLKPISFERFLQAYNNFMERREGEVEINEDNNISVKTDFIYVRSERKMIKITFEDILYIESMSDYVNIVLKQKEVITRETITKIEQLLPEDFIRIHRSFIVSVPKIESFTHEIIEICGKELPVSRNYRDTVLNKLKLHMLG